MAAATTATAAAQVGNYSDFGAQGAVNLPISDTFAARVAFNTEIRDSFYNVTGPNGSAYTGNPGKLRTYSGRIGFLWKPNDALSVLWKTDFNYLDLGAYPADPWNATRTCSTSPPTPRSARWTASARYGPEDRLRAARRHHVAIGLGLSTGPDGVYQADLDGTAS